MLHTQDVDSLARKLDAPIGLITRARQREAYEYTAIHVNYTNYIIYNSTCTETKAEFPTHNRGSMCACSGIGLEEGYIKSRLLPADEYPIEYR